MRQGLHYLTCWRHGSLDINCWLGCHTCRFPNLPKWLPAFRKSILPLCSLRRWAWIPPKFYPVSDILSTEGGWCPRLGERNCILVRIRVGKVGTAICFSTHFTRLYVVTAHGTISWMCSFAKSWKMLDCYVFKRKVKWYKSKRTATWNINTIIEELELSILS